MRKRKCIVSKIVLIFCLFVLTFSTVTVPNTVTTEAASKKINMKIFKKQSVRKFFERKSGDYFGIKFANRKEFNKKLPQIVRFDFHYAFIDKYCKRYKYNKSMDMLVPKKVVHKHIYDVYGVKVTKVKLPVRNGKYVLHNLWIQDTTEFVFSKAVRKGNGAVITTKWIDVFGYYTGKTVFTVRKANNSRGFVITSIKNYPCNAQNKPTISVNTGSTGNSTCAINVTCSSGGTIAWRTSNSSVATVDSYGNVTAKGTGTAVITATVNVNGKTYPVSKTVKISSRKQYGSWSGWSLNPEYGNSNQEVRTTALYRYYCFLCPVCGGREPLQGTSDCHKYNLTLSNAVEGWFTTPYSACSSTPYSYAKYKRYTFSLGDGQRWNFSTGNINDHAIGTKDSDSAAIVIRTGYSKRSVSTVYYISSIN